MHYIDLINKIQSVLSKDLLSPTWKNIVEDGDHVSTGHCYIAAEAIYHLLGGKEAGLKPYVAREGDETHWWIQRGQEIIDPTAEQYLSIGLYPPYSKGKGSGFLTKDPSKRAKLIISRMKA